MTPEPLPPVVARRRRKVDEAPKANGHATEPIPSPPPFDDGGPDANLDDLKAWSTGTEALARMPARRKLILTDSIPAMRLEARRELEQAAERIDRLRWEPEAMLDSRIGEKLGARILAGIETTPPPPLLIDRLDPLGHTILYGTGGVGKGTLAAYWACALLETEKRVLIVDYENHPEEWARRIYGFGASELMSRVLHVAPLTAAWGGARGAIWQQADDLRQLATAFEADYMLIDSIVTGCAGSDPLKPEAVSLYTGALEYIGLPVLSLGHVDKADNLRYPFGSVFWHNLSRFTYSMKADGARVILQNRKHNNYPRLAPMNVEVSWNDTGIPVDLWERNHAEDLARRISSVLVGQSLTVPAICAALDDEAEEDAEPVKPDTISKALRRGSTAVPTKFVKEGERWRNA